MVSARSQGSRQQKKSQNRWIIAIPLIAVVFIAAVYYVSTLPTPGTNPAMDFTDQILVEVNSPNGTINGYITPVTTINGQKYPTSLGQPGGIWMTHQYDRYGVANYYPLYMDNSQFACPPQHACTFHVKSTVVWNYTLSDFLAVWGYPIVSLNDSMGIKSNGNYQWELCLGTAGQAVPELAWGAMVLSPQLAITLIYYNTVTGFGCA